jgi:Ca-activated chloride channel homolog
MRVPHAAILGWDQLAVFLIVISLATMVQAQTILDQPHVISHAPMASKMGVGAFGNPSLHIIKSDVNLVIVPVNVTDAMQRSVTGLQKENFRIFEGKQPQEIRHFSSEDVPASIGIVVDTSGSMNDKMERVQEAVTEFCETANVQDEFFMITFSDEPHLVTDFTNAPERIEEDLLTARAKGRTALLDAINMGLQKMKDARYGKKALLIISDGGDNHSRYDEKAVKAAAKESDVAIYTIGTFDRYFPTEEERKGPALLSEIAEPSGGRAFTLENTNYLPEVARRIGAELRTQYVLAYRAQLRPHDGKWHKIKVVLQVPKKIAFLQVHAKTGYYASDR